MEQGLVDWDWNWGLGIGLIQRIFAQNIFPGYHGFCRCKMMNTEKWLILLNKVGTCEIIYGNPG